MCLDGKVDGQFASYLKIQAAAGFVKSMYPPETIALRLLRADQLKRPCFLRVVCPHTFDIVATSTKASAFPQSHFIRAESAA
jgi:hypothetical protein